MKLHMCLFLTRQIIYVVMTNKDFKNVGYLKLVILGTFDYILGKNIFFYFSMKKVWQIYLITKFLKIIFKTK